MVSEKTTEQKDRDALRKAGEIRKEAKMIKIKKEQESLKKKESLRTEFLASVEGEDKIGGYPFEVINKGDNIVIRFRPKSKFAQRPDRIIFSINLDKIDVEKLKNILE
jgi:hypothetical protein